MNPYGLENLGNTCYLNTLIQTLLSISDLPNNLDDIGLSHQLLKICKSFQNSDVGIRIPRSMYTTLLKLVYETTKLNLSGQQDICEVFGLMMDIIDKESPNSNYVYDSIHPLVVEVKQTPIILRKQQRELLKQNNLQIYLEHIFKKKMSKTVISKFSNMFQGYLLRILDCPLCGYVKYGVESYTNMCLDINGCNSLIDAFNKLSTPEILDDDNKWNCGHCKKLVNARKQIIIHTTPIYWYISLKRFTYLGKKITSLIHFPLQLSIANNIYTLIAVNNHVGSINNGHYFCYAKRHDEWYIFDDEKVHKINEVVSQHAYMLLYQKTN